MLSCISVYSTVYDDDDDDSPSACADAGTAIIRRYLERGVDARIGPAVLSHTNQENQDKITVPSRGIIGDLGRICKGTGLGGEKYDHSAVTEGMGCISI